MAVIAGERRIVTVLFADIVDSTAISERLGPERFTLLVDEVMRVMSAEVERFDGTVVQYIGDELGTDPGPDLRDLRFPHPAPPSSPRRL